MDAKVHKPFLNRLRCLNLLLLLCFVNYCGSSTEHVTGTKGGDTTLSCELQDHEISVIVLSRLSRNILVCQNDECKSENGRVLKKGSYDIVLKDLIYSDAGKYTLKVYHKNTQTPVEQQIMEYNLHIQDEISVKTGEQLKMDVLLINADKVEKNSSGEWTEVWTRGHGVSSDRLTDRDGNLTISNFTVTDTGTYRVLDSEGEILITVTVTESGTGSKREPNKDDDYKPNKLYNPWIIVVSMSGALLVLVLSALIWKYKCQKKKSEHVSVPVQHTELYFRTSRDNADCL